MKGKCPTCRRKLRRDEVNSVAAFLIDKIPLKCKYDSCQERDKLANILQHEKTCTRRAQDGQDQDEDKSDEDEDEREEEREEEDVRVMIVPNRAGAVFNRFQEFATAIVHFIYVSALYKLVYFTVTVPSVKVNVWIFVFFTFIIQHLTFDLDQ